MYDHEWRKVRARVLAGAQVCAICAKPLDWDAPPRSRWAPSVDHRLPVSRTRGLDDELRRRLSLDPSALIPVHVSCNSRRGNGRRDRPRHVSRDWS
jgi:hypothetical protein